MSKRWVRWTGGGLLVLLLSVVGWRLSLEIPERVRRAGAALVDAAAREGIGVRYGGLKLHLLHLHISIDNVVLRDALADLPLGSVGSVDVSFSPLRFLAGDLPVSRVRVRNFHIEAGERNRALYDRWIRRGRKARVPPFPRFFLWTDRSSSLSPARSAGFRPSSGKSGFARGASSGRISPRPSNGRKVTWRCRGTRAGPGRFHRSRRTFSTRREFCASGSSRRQGTPPRFDFPARSTRGSGSCPRRRRENWISQAWIAAGAPGVSYVRRVARLGKAEFSVTADGPWNDPEAAARLVFRNAGFPGAAGAEGEVQLSLRGRVLRLARANAKLWGGVLEADGLYRTESGRMEGKASLRRVSLAAVPWKALGVPVSLAGTGDASVRLAGTADRLEGTVSLALPGGIERISSPGGSGPALRFPMSLEAGGSVSGGRDVKVASFRLLAGKAELRGDGDGSIAGETLRLRGSLSLPGGKSADFGVGEPLAWEKVAGEWDISGPWSRLGGKASVSVTALSIRALPPFRWY